MISEVNKEESKKLNWKDFLPIILALPMAMLFKLFIFTTYHVPTASMTPTIIPGDHILVEKWIFGARFFIQNEPWRIPGWRTIEKGDILVFNVPKEDSIFRKNREINYYKWKHTQAASTSSISNKDSFQFMPIPGRTPYVKRVIGTPGDDLVYMSHRLLINGNQPFTPPHSFQHYDVYFKRTNEFDFFKDTLYQLGENIRMNRSDGILSGIFKAESLNFLISENIRVFSKIYFPIVDQIPEDFTWARSLAHEGEIMKIPFKGWRVPIDRNFLRKYGKLISRFEDFEGTYSGTGIRDSEGHLLDTYVFTKNYYWTMGDNRPYSVDSRAWGLIPEDHIIGITRKSFWSKEPEKSFRYGFRWNRFWANLD